MSIVALNNIRGGTLPVLPWDFSPIEFTHGPRWGLTRLQDRINVCPVELQSSLCEWGCWKAAYMQTTCHSLLTYLSQGAWHADEYLPSTYPFPCFSFLTYRHFIVSTKYLPEFYTSSLHITSHMEQKLSEMADRYGVYVYGMASLLAWFKPDWTPLIPTQRKSQHQAPRGHQHVRRSWYHQGCSGYSLYRGRGGNWRRVAW